MTVRCMCVVQGTHATAGTAPGCASQIYLCPGFCTLFCILCEGLLVFITLVYQDPPQPSLFPSRSLSPSGDVAVPGFRAGPCPSPVAWDYPGSLQIQWLVNMFFPDVNPCIELFVRINFLRYLCACVCACMRLYPPMVNLLMLLLYTH